MRDTLLDFVATSVVWSFKIAIIVIIVLFVRAFVDAPSQADRQGDQYSTVGP